MKVNAVHRTPDCFGCQYRDLHHKQLHVDLVSNLVMLSAIQLCSISQDQCTFLEEAMQANELQFKPVFISESSQKKNTSEKSPNMPTTAGVLSICAPHAATGIQPCSTCSLEIHGQHYLTCRKE